MATNRGPWRLVTVNTTPKRTKRLIRRMIKTLKDYYGIEYVDKCEIAPKVTKDRPNVLFCASMWTPEQSDQAFTTAKSIVSDLKTHVILTRLQDKRGPDAVVEYLVEEVPKFSG
ncbi:hypothetical protein B0J13DRAFT_584330 [Dactylonectria estremocensis]|uniref:Uncharacterized protein n=1 Tax=Dactylonectria estremocensis TaxID=1079267 RepID=A0A9P9EWX1_9HYPO|nr:hypothetical protein B0J13DRAFT_584330 [Dactylonectria estremocensis]